MRTVLVKTLFVVFLLVGYVPAEAAPSAKVILYHMKAGPDGREVFDRTPREDLWAGIRFGFEIAVSGLDPAVPHVLVYRCYYEDDPGEWIRWVDESDVPTRIAKGSRSVTKGFVVNIPGMPGNSLGRERIEVWVDGKRVATKTYDRVLPPPHILQAIGRSESDFFKRPLW